ncbi:translocation/assembly module TamB domain-containing protein [Ekhidna sp.]|uniref:translocation/assembly module TamB domain-containing protein n=1 Tax=Ekhidna sp. TaxID=2608089 RepID=UPI003299488E
MSLSRLKISWLDQASLEEILIKDLEGDTMLYAESLEINYRIWDIIQQEYLNIEEISANKLDLNLIKHGEDEKLNLTQFINALKTDTVKKESKPVRLDRINLTNLTLRLNDITKKPKPTRLDFANLDFTIPDFSLTNFHLRADTISGNIINMRGIERNSDFTIEEFKTVFWVCNSSLSIDDLNFRTPTSQVSDSLAFFYNGLDDLAYFQDSVSFILHFNKTRISKEDIKIIAGTDKLENDITIDGIIWGTIGDFNIEETRFGYGSSYFVGGVSCFGLPDLSKTFILADITKSHVLPRDLRPYLGEYTDNLRQMGRIDFSGSFAGFFKDFVARGDFVTDQGSVHSDINIKIPDDPKMMSYVGNLEFKNLNVGAFLKNDIAQIVNLKATINGVGITPENADFDLKALIYNSGLNGYVYDSVSADGRFAKNFFEGSFFVEDPNCDLKGNAQVDFRKNQEVLNVDVKVNTFNSDELQISRRNLGAFGNINLEVKDLDLDHFIARLEIDSGEIELDERRVPLDSIRFIADLKDSTRTIKLAFPGFWSKVEGEFRITDVLKDVKLMAQSYASELMIIDDTVDAEGSGNTYKLKLEARIDNVSPYLDSLKIPVDIGGKTIIEGDFRQSKNANISLYFKSDSLELGKNLFLNPIVELNGSRDDETKSILTNFIFQSNEQVIPGVPNTQELLVEGVWYDNEIDLTTMVNQPQTESEIRLESAVTLYEDSIIFKMLPSDMRLLGDNWKFKEANKIVLTSNKIDIQDLEIFDASESIILEGVYADSIPTSITVSTEGLNMNKAELFSKASVGGLLNGEFKMFRENSDESFKFDGGFLLKNLSYDEIQLGDVRGSSNWNPSNQSIYTKVDVERQDVNTIEVEGYYYPLAESEQLDFDIKFDEADLKMGQPFLQENFSNISGLATGSLKLTGSVEKPKVIGNCNISDGSVLINYLNTFYVFDGGVDFNSSSITFSNFNLTDRKGSNARVSGSIRHNSFKNMAMDLKIRASTFEFLNTTSLDNNLYYGTAYGSGTIDVTGPLNDLNIAASIRTEADTKFFIPISDGTNSTQQEYITFIDFSDSTRADVEEEFNISGLTLDFDIEVTPDAYCELIFDIKTGDIIRGRGRGNLKLRLDTDGEFNMFGPLEITEGAYNFTVPNFINKEFEVVSGSMITWYGEPYNAILDLDATYLQRASFAELENPDKQTQENLANKVPILVVLRLEGGMLSPEIDFDLQLQNESDATSANVSELSQITSDEQELKRQVISLLFLKRFSPRQSFTLSGGGTVGNSVSEFLSSQVSYLVSQIDENLEVEVNLADLNREAFNTFQLRFAYTFLDGRLKVTRGGDFGNQNDNNDNVLNDIVGDWSVEYSLTKDGRLRAKVFRNSNQRILTNQNQQNQETGISLRFVHSFNDFAELLSLKRDEAIQKREQENKKAAESGASEKNSTQ